MTARVSTLQERLLRDELASLSSISTSKSLVEAAYQALIEAHRTRTQLAQLLEAIGQAPSRQAELIAACAEAFQLPKGRGKGAVRGRKRRQPSLSALTESATRKALSHELRSEAALALARTRFTGEQVAEFLWEHVGYLASVDGRWSRRREALALLKLAAKFSGKGAVPSEICQLALAIAQPAEHRWLQAPALALLAELDDTRARDLAWRRISSPLAGEDFLVRDRIVDFAGRRRTRAWAQVVKAALTDPSELVRLSAVRFERDLSELEQLLLNDASHRVRAYAGVALVRRLGDANEEPLLRVFAQEEHPFVVVTIAQELERRARHQRLVNGPSVIFALMRSAEQSALPERVRNQLLEAAAAVHVLTTPALARAHRELAWVVAGIPVGRWAELPQVLPGNARGSELGQVLSLLARDDFPLSVEERLDGTRLYRGEQRGFALWRLLYEITHPAPNKRQGHVHSTARKPRGSLRAPSRKLAELTATAVPGEPVFCARTGDYGPHLPLVDDLLSLGLLKPEPVSIVTATGTTILTPPADLAKRLENYFRLSNSYAEFADLRSRCLNSEERALRRRYAERIQNELQIELTYRPHLLGDRWAGPVPEHFGVGLMPSDSRIPVTGSASAGLFMGALGGTLPVWIEDLTRYALSLDGNSLPHIAGFSAAILGGFLARALVHRRSIDTMRRSLPLVIGGWGTRGKSGTARLKGALFQGLGYECLVKTTGCEAMFIHAIPGVTAREVFVYRPYDKASIWEQKHVLELAHSFDVKVFIWECMALQPELVQLLQLQWMRDDYSTITNAFPDHEDLQGPTGRDVAQVISQFIPEKGRVFSAEDQMLPVLKERAQERGSSLTAFTDRDAELIPEDLLRRFPYHEHPKNIALVAGLARSFNVPATIAIAEMADNVVPDLGVLKTYPSIPCLGRTLSFTNGMSANERTGALANWERMGFSRIRPDQAPGRWVATVVNNRADRLARSRVFAKFIVQDIGAHRHVLIGTNVSGLLRMLEEELAQYLASIDPTESLSGELEEKRATLRRRIEQAFEKLLVGRASPELVARELEAWGAPPLEPGLLARLLTPPSYESHTEAASVVNDGLGSYPEPWRKFVRQELVRRRSAEAMVLAAAEWQPSDSQRLREAFTTNYRALFFEQIVPIEDSAVNGDFVLSTVSQSAPPNTHLDIMGLQNIKGTGLDFVYRWVSIELVTEALRRMQSASPEERRDGFSKLMSHDDFGLYDATLALQVLKAGVAGGEGASAEQAWDVLIRKLEKCVEVKSRAVSSSANQSLKLKFRDWVGFTFDYADSVRREQMARRLMGELVSGAVSHAQAAVGMRNIISRAKGNWIRMESKAQGA